MEIEVNINYYTGIKTWHIKGTPGYWHRENGPARIHKNGREYWFYYNEKYNTPEEMPLNLYLAYCKWEYKKNGQV